MGRHKLLWQGVSPTSRTGWTVGHHLCVAGCDLQRLDAMQQRPQAQQMAGEDTHMTGPPGSGKTSDDGGLEYERESATGMPRWAKVLLITVAVVALLIVVMLLVGGMGGHRGPGGHASLGQTVNAKQVAEFAQSSGPAT
jgi:hypothetical protein